MTPRFPFRLYIISLKVRSSTKAPACTIGGTLRERDRDRDLDRERGCCRVNIGGRASCKITKIQFTFSGYKFFLIIGEEKFEFLLKFDEL